MRRILTILLSVYVLGLAVTPCADTARTDPHDMAFTESHADMDHPVSHMECTPFCTCTCCGVVISVDDIPVYTSFEIRENFADNFPLHNSSPRRYHHSFLEPPQLV
ncbi:DUF6660 family protein [Sinomicrobium weinanense]|uniref:DUF2946 domain-containing protein n=1 Tax=Sinomicrobium weinanense TaxID=2842200 RepID=A0A926JSU9_9FLAO|nr:DUF6660 family protein [Sinomicrobium weinanense]MBC9796729.1 hypothetical protein [Sinomicrobium weinanense]MBU3124000.1 hypothetical protein [Sinomicrobium weinanense]